MSHPMVSFAAARFEPFHVKRLRRVPSTSVRRSKALVNLARPGCALIRAGTSGQARLSDLARRGLRAAGPARCGCAIISPVAPRERSSDRILREGLRDPIAQNSGDREESHWTALIVPVGLWVMRTGA